MIFEKTSICQLDPSLTSAATVPQTPVVVPDYLEKTYWWAYTHPNAVRVFERQWLVNLILWGNFSRLRDLALQDMGEVISGQVLQVACVYGNLTEHIVRRLDPQAHLSVIDVAPVQIKNLHQKLRDKRQVSILQQDASNLGFAEWGSFLKNDHLTAALIDRLTENSHVINMKGCKSLRAPLTAEPCAEP